MHPATSDNRADMNDIKAACDKHVAVIVEDAAESLGASYRGKQTDSFGKYGVISFKGDNFLTADINNKTIDLAA